MALPVSVVIVSRGRPDALSRCLRGVAQLDYPTFEVVVVACPAGAARVVADGIDEMVKLVPFDEANISAARNLGVAASAGEVVAFIDDDAVPEPLWLLHLAAPFEEDDVSAAGGYVIGRNGISFQWRARSVDATGVASAIDLPDMTAQVLHPHDGRAIQTEGTNMAVRRSVLVDLRGFDAAFRFFHDETDLNQRLAQAGHATAIVPLAQVHHGFEASARRRADRVPTDLSEIGASQMLFLRKHAPAAMHRKTWRAFRNDQRLRLLRHMQAGRLGPDDVWRLLRGLDRGAKEGQARAFGQYVQLPFAKDGFRGFMGRPGAERVLVAGRHRDAARLRAEAARAASEGAIVTLLLFSSTALFHRVRFNEDGVWEQTGGLFGRSVRTAPLFRFWRRSSRIKAEISRIVSVRGHYPDAIDR